MTKPVKRARYAYDYHEAEGYIITTYAIPKRRSGDTWWHFVCDIKDYMRNESYIHFSNDDLEYVEFKVEPWQREIMEHFLTEFGEGEHRECTFWVEW